MDCPKKACVGIFAGVLAVSVAFARAGGDGERDIPVRELAERNRALVERYGKSVVTVRYWLKKNEKGEEPKLRVPYLCPNCRSTHWREGNEDVAKRIPLEISGFVTAPDRVIVQDLRIPAEFVASIAVVTPSGEVKASEFERSLRQEALQLKAEKPLDGLKPLVFTGVEPKVPAYFFVASEAGERVSGIARSARGAFRHHIDLGIDDYEGRPNTLVLDETGAAVTVAMEKRVVLGEETFAAPSAWTWEPAGAVAGRLAALRAKIAKGVFPVYVQLEAKAKDEKRRSFFSMSSDDESKNDIDTMGVLLENGKVLVTCALKPQATERLQRMEATLPDGTKRTLRFVGSLADQGGLVAAFEGGAPEGVEALAFDRRPAGAHYGEKVWGFLCFNRSGSFEFRETMAEFSGFKRVDGNEIVPEYDAIAGLRLDYDRTEKAEAITVSAAGALLEVKMAERRQESRYSRETSFVSGARLWAISDRPKFNAENVPRTEENRKRTAWFGVEVQAAGADIVREKKAASYLDGSVERAPLVTAVATNSPAAAAGVREGDILVAVRYADGGRRQRLSADGDVFGGFDWSGLFAREEFMDAAMLGGMTPWPSLEGGMNASFAEFGVGAKVEVEWVRDGVKMSAVCTLALAPVHYENAPRKRSKDLGITVADMTDEVRKYFRFAADAPGVVITKVKSGGVAAVSGLKPLEIVTEVNGEGVKDAKDFAAKTRDRKDLNFTVRRLTATRMVPVKLDK